MRYSIHQPNLVRPKLATLTSDSLEDIAAMAVDLEHALEEMTEERDEALEMIASLEAEQ